MQKSTQNILMIGGAAVLLLMVMKKKTATPTVASTPLLTGPATQSTSCQLTCIIPTAQRMAQCGIGSCFCSLGCFGM
jgi:hypothetical protein